MTCYHVKYMIVARHPFRLRSLRIGIYGSAEQAHTAIAFLSARPGFRLHPHRFFVYRTFPLRRPTELNRTYWINGFDRRELLKR